MFVKLKNVLHEQDKGSFGYKGYQPNRVGKQARKDIQHGQFVRYE